MNIRWTLKTGTRFKLCLNQLRLRQTKNNLFVEKETNLGEKKT